MPAKPTSPAVSNVPMTREVRTRAGLPDMSLERRRTPMEPPEELAHWACGLCDSTAAELSTPTHPPLDGRSVIRAHVLDVHNVLVADLEASTQIRPTWTLPDGRVWLREV